MRRLRGLRWFSTNGAAQPPARAGGPGQVAHPAPQQLDPEIVTPEMTRPPGVGVYVLQPPPKPGKAAYWRRYLAFAKPQWVPLAASVLCLGAYSFATLSIPSGFGTLIDFACKGELPLEESLKLIGLFAIAGVSNFLRLSVVGYAGECVIAKIRTTLYSSILRQEAAFFDRTENVSGSLTQRLTGDTAIIGVTLTETFSNGLKNVLQMVGSLGVMFYLSPPLSAVILLILPPLSLVAGKYGKFIQRLQRLRQDTVAVSAGVANERLAQMHTVKSFAREVEEAALYDRHVQKVFKTSMRMVVFSAAYTAFLHVGGYFTLYALVWGGSLLVASKEITAGVLFSFMLYTVYCGLGIMGSVNFIADLNKGFGASIKLFELVDAESTDAALAADAKEVIPPGDVHIAVRDLVFSYPTRPDSVVFRGVSFDIQPGMCTAVVGPSGCGKSSIAKIILGLYGRYDGTIDVCGIPLRKLDIKKLRNVVGYVPQDPVLFGGTIAQNVAYGIPGREWDAELDAWTLTAVKEAAIKANAHEFIMQLPDGYNTQVGESGKSLSGGQKQRIAIARALIKGPKLLILDEATSALDVDTEKVVQQTIEKNKDSKLTMLVIAHRVSMIQCADHIVVLNEGKLEVCGSFEEVSNNTYFRNLVGV